MTINSRRFTSESGEDDLLIIFLKDDEGNELERYAFYINDNNSKLDRDLKKSIQQLPQLLENIYKKGESQEEVNFTNDVVKIN